MFFIFNVLAWEIVKNEDGIQVSRTKPDHSEVYVYRTTAMINAPAEKVASIVMDTANATKWYPDLKEVKIIEDTNTTRVAYWHIGTPAVLKDRDFLFKSNLNFMPKEKTLEIHFESVEHSNDPNPNNINGNVRGKMHPSYYRIKANGNSTELTLLIHVDPLGSTSKWIINNAQKEFPFKTVKGLQKRVLDDVKIFPELKQLFQGVENKEIAGYKATLTL